MIQLNTRLKLSIGLAISIFFTLLSPSSFAHFASPAYPKGCEARGFAFRQQYLLINESGNQSFYLFHNHSQDMVEIEHIENRANQFMSPKLKSILRSDHWSAFASDISSYAFQCFLSEGEQRRQVACEDFLDICQYPRVKFALSNRGTYWVSTNKSSKNVIQEAVTKGIYLRW